MSIREDVELYTKLSGEDGSQETIGTIGAYLRGYRQGKADAEPHWISCNERLPEKPNKTYLVTLDYGEQGRAIGQVFYHFEPIGWADSAVVAWMPLPEPYKGVTE